MSRRRPSSTWPAASMLRMPAFGSLGLDLLAFREAAAAAESTADAAMLVIDIVDLHPSPSSTGRRCCAFEDLQWADDLSLEIIGDLARRTRDRPLLLVGALSTRRGPAGTSCVTGARAWSPSASPRRSAWCRSTWRRPRW